MLKVERGVFEGRKGCESNDLRNTERKWKGVRLSIAQRNFQPFSAA